MMLMMSNDEKVSEFKIKFRTIFSLVQTFLEPKINMILNRNGRLQIMKMDENEENRKIFVFVTPKFQI